MGRNNELEKRQLQRDIDILIRNNRILAGRNMPEVLAAEMVKLEDLRNLYYSKFKTTYGEENGRNRKAKKNNHNSEDTASGKAKCSCGSTHTRACQAASLGVTWHATPATVRAFRHAHLHHVSWNTTGANTTVINNITQVQAHAMKQAYANSMHWNQFVNATHTIPFATVETDEPELELEVVHEQMPILASRYAGLMLFDSLLEEAGQLRTAKLISIGWNDNPFEIDEDAVCHAYVKCGDDAPSAHCGCGFYAVPADKLPNHPYEYGKFILQVELTGKIIEHEEGYRAAHQHVLEMQVQDCRCCGSPSEVVVWWSDRHSCGSCCARCLKMLMDHPYPTNFNAVFGSCIDTIDYAQTRPMEVMSLSTISKQLGIPVTRYHGN